LILKAGRDSLHFLWNQDILSVTFYTSPADYQSGVRGVSFSVHRLRFGMRAQLMSKQIRRRPEVEGLEPMTLLSGMTGVAAHVEALAKTPPVPNPIHLTGTLSGTLTKKGHGETLTAKGNLSPFRKVSFSGPATALNITGGVSNLTIPDKTSKLFVTLNLTPGGTTLSGTYTITGGTKTLAGETGSGNVTVTVTSVVSPIHFGATFS
jgi:hypothetical protein